MSDIRSYKNIVPQIDPKAYIDKACTIIGDVHIGEQTSIWCGVVIRGDVNYIRIGARTSIQDLSMLHVTHNEPDIAGFPLIIGDDVTIGHSVILHGCTLHDRTFIGMGCTILDGAVIESDSMLGAGTLVPQGQVVQSGWLYLGSPAKKFRQLTKEEIINIKQHAQNYIGFAQDFKKYVRDVN